MEQSAEAQRLAVARTEEAAKLEGAVRSELEAAKAGALKCGCPRGNMWEPGVAALRQETYEGLHSHGGYPQMDGL